MAAPLTSMNMKPIDLTQVRPFRDKSADEIKDATRSLGQEGLKKLTDYLDGVIQGLLPNKEGNSSAISDEDRKAVAEDLAKNLVAARRLMENSESTRSDVGANISSSPDYDTVLNSLTRQTIAILKGKLSDIGGENKFTKGLKEALQDAVTGSQKNLSLPPAPLKTDIANPSEQPIGEDTKASLVTPISLDQIKDQMKSTAAAIPEATRNDENYLNRLNSALGKLANFSESQVDDAMKSFSGKALDKLKENVLSKLGDETQFNEAVSELNDVEKAQLKMLLTMLRDQKKEEDCLKAIGKSISEINSVISPQAKSNLSNSLTSLINSAQSNEKPLGINYENVQSTLESFNQKLEAVAEKPQSEQAQARMQAQEEFICGLKQQLKDRNLNKADLELINKAFKSADPVKSVQESADANKTNILKSLKETFSAEDLKQFGAVAGVLALGVMIFCPKLITGTIGELLKAGTGMAGQYLPLLMMQAMQQKDNANSQPSALATGS